MTLGRLLALTCLAMAAFAGNSLLCRFALKETGIDAASFTSIRIVSGALALWLLVALRGSTGGKLLAHGSWSSAFALFGYAAFFSFAYTGLSAGTGALLLFGAVQSTMIGYGLYRGERLTRMQSLGLLAALGGLVGLLLPGLSAPPWGNALLMLAAGIAWGIYSIRGKGAPDPLRVTASNFLFAAVPALLLSAATLSRSNVTITGAGYAVASGAIASGVGYALWYTALRGLASTVAATVQLSVPVLTALGGVALLGEPVSIRLSIASLVVLGGIALVIQGAGVSRCR